MRILALWEISDLSQPRGNGDEKILREVCAWLMKLLLMLCDINRCGHHPLLLFCAVCVT